jgi:hypothetical protein
MCPTIAGGIGVRLQPNASMARRIRFSHARHAVDRGRRDHDRSDCDGFSLVGA